MLTRLLDSFHGLARDLRGDVPPDDLARCRAGIGTLEHRLDDVVARQIAAFDAAI